MLPANLRITLGISLVIYFGLILLFLKKRAIELKYTLLWLLAGGCMTILIVFPSILPAFLYLLGITENMNGLFIICIAFLMMLCMALTSIVSRQTGKIRKLTQDMAILEKEIREIRNEAGRKQELQ